MKKHLYLIVFVCLLIFSGCSNNKKTGTEVFVQDFSGTVTSAQNTKNNFSYSIQEKGGYNGITFYTKANNKETLYSPLKWIIYRGEGLVGICKNRCHTNNFIAIYEYSNTPDKFGVNINGEEEIYSNIDIIDYNKDTNIITYVYTNILGDGGITGIKQNNETIIEYQFSGENKIYISNVHIQINNSIEYTVIDSNKNKENKFYGKDINLPGNTNQIYNNGGSGKVFGYTTSLPSGKEELYRGNKK